ncbi:hypothetical protein ACGFRB_19570 [Streptomyces sp. NPDC048718]|uniref:hypothetical protein n=1 Tax=Streptomyces sp. NPDC048718 TaxID=3365587 RepID=UPI00371A9200
MAWDEWEKLKAEAAAARHDGGMRLNSTGDGAGPADLKTNAQGKSGAINALRNHIGPGVDKAGIHADETTDAAELEFTGWATGAGLKDAHAEWALQVKSLRGRLAYDQEALGRTKSDFRYVDHGVKSSLGGIVTAKPDPHPHA